MKIVITGALGHIGSLLIRTLPLPFPESEIYMIDNMMTQRYCSLFDLPKEGKYKFFDLDILKDNMDHIFNGAEVVIHLAAITDAANSFNNKEEVEKVNYHSTVKVSEACLKHDCSLIHLSSTSVYGTQEDLVDEDCGIEDLQPQSPYAETKLREEDYLLKMSETKNLRFINCRFGTIAGTSPGMRFHTAVNKFCWQAVMEQPITVWRTALHQKRPYLALDEAIEAFNFIIKENIFDSKTYNVLSNNLTVNDIIENIKTHIPKIEIEYVDTKIMNQLSYEVSNQRFANKGFKYKGNVSKSISDIIQRLQQSGSISQNT